MPIPIPTLYHQLVEKHGPQGWWPLLGLKKYPSGYHKNNYDYPKNGLQVFEIGVGAILTQNSTWKNAEKALIALKNSHNLHPNKILKLEQPVIAVLIKSAGYFNQKSYYLKNFSKFFLTLNGKTPTRENLLNVIGIGPETADSILLYAYKKPHFIIDTYTQRFLIRNKIIPSKQPYEKLKKMMEDAVSPYIKIYQEFHALIVEEEKRVGKING
ncbi:MAG: hypothetical protein A3H98_11025 [Bacteroidetes bacterium RIFCSPLOWO2_02_FULL_36_8]|nr:MAG: hypothetical protein A3H98_11025 [Bacteroidetes bacterium RIFCSPLOWO2_02_FULL_36_8]OFY71241.1 MAG: hypothetical protein A3G23_01840 [Bacteroidetes bacterium RIFCSPLOWO2_12_FULL_37_12]